MGLFGPPNVRNLKAKRDIKGLIKALRYNDLNTPWSAAMALEAIGDARAVEPLSAALKHPYSEVREAAAKALGRIGDARAVEPLNAALKDQNWEVQRAAADALGRIGDAHAVGPLIAALMDGTVGAVRYAARDTLIKIKTPAVEALIIALSDIPEMAAEALGQIGDARAVEPLCAILQDTRCGVRAAAAEALGDIGDRRAVEPLSAALQDAETSVREAAIAALGKIGGDGVVGPLIVALKDQHEHISKAAESALMKTGAPAIGALIEALREKRYMRKAAGILDCLGWKPDTDEDKAWFWVGKENWKECVKLGKPAVEPLIAILNGNEAAADALGQIGDERAVAPLVAEYLSESGTRCSRHAILALRDLYRSNKMDAATKRKILALPQKRLHDHYYDRTCDIDEHSDYEVIITKGIDDLEIDFVNMDLQSATAAQDVAAMPSASPVSHTVNVPLDMESIAAILAGEDAEACQQACMALLQMWNTAAAEMLIKAFTFGRHGGVIGATLGMLGADLAVPSLINALGDQDVELRRVASSVIGYFGDVRAIEPLVITLKDENAQVSMNARNALEKLAQAEKESVRQAAKEALEKNP